MSSELVLLDTDVLVDLLRGHRQAIAFVEENTDRMVLSSIVVAELYAGVRGDQDGEEQTVLRGLLSSFRTIPTSAEIARLGGIYKRDYGKSHGVGLADALIAATATVEGAGLATLNVKHYPMIQNLEPAYRK